MNLSQESLLAVLKQFFGFSSFRPLQEDIIRDVLAGKDAFALLPTGGGKSLCYQLPAVMRPGLTLVISPLISLMKDQVDALHTGGIPATFLNSSLTPEQARNRVQELHDGKYRLLYVAPERTALAAFRNDVKNWHVNQIAVDEAHCISEWGHDFRPEYRQLAELRDMLPEVPFVAMTATATKRVRQDIVGHLRLRSPKCYVASFDRPNLTYNVLPKNDPYGQLLAFVGSRKSLSGIVYCQSRKTTESVASRLQADGIVAAPYHAGLDPSLRARYQEQFLRDDIHVICATIAFGMGINKPNVRFIVHYDLAKNIEGYYQETGRAGRDGLPSDCLLLFSGADVVKHLRFIQEKEDEQERRVAKMQLEQMVHFAESGECRRAMLLEYFAEKYPNATCGSCDNCLTPRDAYDGTIDAQKLLSCAVRIREKSGFCVGLRTIAEVLTGSNTEKLRRLKYSELSTYGIGRDKTSGEWMSIGRELLRLRLLEKLENDGFPVVEVTALGNEALRERRTILLKKPIDDAAALKTAAGPQDFDELLFDQLRSLRKQIADERNVAAFIVFSDAALRQMAREYPVDETAFRRISGVGEKKLRDFGPLFIEQISVFLAMHERREFKNDGAPAAAVGASRMNDTTFASLSLFRSNKSVEQIAAIRGLRPGTVFDHLYAAASAGESVDLNRLMPSEEQRKAEDAFARLGHSNLRGVYESLGEQIHYSVLRIFRLQKYNIR